MRSRILSIGFALAIIGCEGSSLSNIKAPDRLTIFSINGCADPEFDKDDSGETFHRYPVLGKVEITDHEYRKRLIVDLNQAVNDGRNAPHVACFRPRHGIRVVENGKTTDFLICFECSQMKTIADRKFLKSELIDSKAQAKFSKLLLDAGVPIAP